MLSEKGKFLLCVCVFANTLLSRQATHLTLNHWHRYATFEKYDEQIKNTIGYEEFTKGYEYYGFNVQKDNSVMYREWAPNAVTASLVGDFSKCYHKCLLGGVQSARKQE